MRTTLFTIFLLSIINSFSQDIPSFKALRYDEDYSFLKKDSSKNWYRKTKFSPISKNQTSYISFGGEMRFQYFYIDNEGWGDEPKDDDGYTLTRLLAHADIHTKKHFRVFFQLQSSLANSRASPGPVDDNPLELHQGFADFTVYCSSKSKLTFRLGRQEFSYGSQRLISVRDNPNNRQSFDAIRSLFISEKAKIDIFYSHYVKAQKNIFDDGFNRNSKFWGAYIVRNNVSILKNIDFYYLGIWKRQAMFDDGSGKELRHSVGSRIWNLNERWKYDIEAVYQFGTFADKNISAWTASINTSYIFNKVKFTPEVGLKTELISGDKNYGDEKLQTFNPLFPRGAYFGLAALIGPLNLIDIHPSLSLALNKCLNLDTDYDVFWRYTKNDGLYAINTSPIYSGKNINQKYIGGQLAAALIYRPNGFLYFRCEITWFNASEYLKIAGSGKDILFTGVTAQLKF